MKKVYLICPVRNCSDKQSKENDSYVGSLEANGIVVHYPPRDVKQECDTGVSIVTAHSKAMSECDEVHVIWDSESKGSHFDFGMAVGFGKPLIAVSAVHDDTEGKSYWKVLKEYSINI